METDEDQPEPGSSQPNIESLTLNEKEENAKEVEKKTKEAEKKTKETEKKTKEAAVKAAKKVGSAQLPNDHRKQRACLICALIKTESQFEEEGCDNCERFLRVVGAKGVTSYTSSTFEGYIGVIQPQQSWVAKWQRIVHQKPGLYAINVRGKVHEDIMEEMADARVRYYCRDKTNQDSKTYESGSKSKRKNR